MSDAVTMNPPTGPHAFDLSAYLDRIGLEASPPVSLEGLTTLVRAHRMAIPFENLDIPLGHGISLAPGAIFDKLVHRRRGGYCFEQNALFHWALAAMGFDGRPLLGRVWLQVGEGAVPERTHQLELVILDGHPWIADVGFGGSLTPPLPLAEGENTTGSDGVRLRLTPDADHGWILSRRGAPSFMDVPEDEAARWQRQYSFTTDPAFQPDMELGNHWTATRPGTLFTSVVMVHLITGRGFASLLGNRLRLREDGETRDLVLATPGAFREAMAAHFGIALSEEEATRLQGFQPGM